MPIIPEDETFYIQSVRRRVRIVLVKGDPYAYDLYTDTHADSTETDENGRAVRTVKDQSEFDTAALAPRSLIEQNAGRKTSDVALKALGFEAAGKVFGRLLGPRSYTQRMFRLDDPHGRNPFSKNKGGFKRT